MKAVKANMILLLAISGQLMIYIENRNDLVIQMIYIAAWFILQLATLGS